MSRIIVKVVPDARHRQVFKYLRKAEGIAVPVLWPSVFTTGNDHSRVHERRAHVRVLVSDRDAPCPIGPWCHACQVLLNDFAVRTSVGLALLCLRRLVRRRCRSEGSEGSHVYRAGERVGGGRAVFLAT